MAVPPRDAERQPFLGLLGVGSLGFRSDESDASGNFFLLFYGLALL
jgi:hypothetical protein